MAKGNNWHLPVRMWSRVGRLPHHRDGDDHNDYDRDDGDDHNDYDDQDAEYDVLVLGLFHISMVSAEPVLKKNWCQKRVPEPALIKHLVPKKSLNRSRFRDFPTRNWSHLDFWACHTLAR